MNSAYENDQDFTQNQLKFEEKTNLSKWAFWRIFWGGSDDTLRLPAAVRLRVKARLSEIILWPSRWGFITISSQFAGLGLYGNWEMRRNNSSAFPIGNRSRGPGMAFGPWVRAAFLESYWLNGPCTRPRLANWPCPCISLRHALGKCKSWTY